MSGKAPTEFAPAATTTTTANNTASAPNTQGSKSKSEAQLKKEQAKAAKAAKRAAKKYDAPDTPAGPPATPKSQQQQGKQQSQASAHGGKKERRGSQGQKAPAVKETALPVHSKKPAVPPKQVGLFGHLYGMDRRHGIEGAAKEVHPAVLALGVQMSSWVVCGSTARCAAMLLCFKSVIQSYNTPVGTSLARHMVQHVLSPQIDYLKSHRPLSVSMGNAIRHLKALIVSIDPSTPDEEAKQFLCDAIDTFIRERITAASTIIAGTAADKIIDGDVILVYANSSVVCKALLLAHSQGKKFRVVVVDSSPLFEGKCLAKDLARADVQTSYYVVTGAAHAVREATKVFLGAAAMMANGRLYSRVGNAIVAMLAKRLDVPVLVLCESYKFTERVSLDSIVNNEVGPAEDLLASLGIMKQPGDATEGGAADEDQLETREARITKWKDTPNLQMLNIMHDLTPAEYITMVVTEFGCLPPSSVPAVLRNLEGTGKENKP
ncbi:nagb/rpia/CoA transferase-like protein [Aulographum hederae CBS 113979]|uniref:Translation initiation factor eIF2B subunit delta n=1 Tax=Aulographum hederae CBS 113979 TaxID=1176131 RepID=A0A6G1HA38_9PEZI|nr:nagb/rpia/CoA transferase-like protein [Aulographum hederae CBS 113979]